MDHFPVFTNIASLFCIPETNIMLHVSYTSIKRPFKRKSNKQKLAFIEFLLRTSFN